MLKCYIDKLKLNLRIFFWTRNAYDFKIQQIEWNTPKIYYCVTHKPLFVRNIKLYNLNIFCWNKLDINTDAKNLTSGTKFLLQATVLFNFR